MSAASGPERPGAGGAASGLGNAFTRAAGRVALVVVVAGCLAACQKVTRKVSASVSPCFRILPLARQAVGGQGTFVDVARIKGRGVESFPRFRGTTTTSVGARSGLVTPSGGADGAEVGGGGQPSVSPSSPSSTASPAAPPGAHRDVCVVAFKGTFDPAKIPNLIGPSRQGRYAVVVVGVQRQQVRAVLLTDLLPSGLKAH